MLDVATPVAAVYLIPKRMQFDDPSVQQLMAQSEALSTALAHTERGADRNEALCLVRRALERGTFLTVEELTIRSAMRLILGQATLTGGESYRFYAAVRPPSRHFFETVARAWMIWAEKGPASEALAELHQLEDPSPKEGALHLMALFPWKLATEALLEEDPAEAKRQFLRSTELGSQFGTETNPVIQWAYAASFFCPTSPLTL